MNIAPVRDVLIEATTAYTPSLLLSRADMGTFFKAITSAFARREMALETHMAPLGRGGPT